MRRFPLLNTMIVVWALSLAGVPLSTAAPAEHSAAKVVLATATQGGGFQLFGQNLAEVINATDPGLAVEAVATRGSRQNLALLEEGKVD